MEDVLTFLSSGGSKYPIDLLKEAGVDMTTSDPFDKTMATMNRTMDEIEKNLKQISEDTGVKDIINLPSTKVYKIKAHFEL